MRSWTWGRGNRGKRGDQEREKDPENEDKERRKKTTVCGQMIGLYRNLKLVEGKGSSGNEEVGG